MLIFHVKVQPGGCESVRALFAPVSGCYITVSSGGQKHDAGGSSFVWYLHTSVLYWNFSEI